MVGAAPVPVEDHLQLRPDRRALQGFAAEVGSPAWPARGAVLAGTTAVLAEGAVEYEVLAGSVAVTRVGGRRGALGPAEVRAVQLTCDPHPSTGG